MRAIWMGAMVFALAAGPAFAEPQWVAGGTGKGEPEKKEEAAKPAPTPRRSRVWNGLKDCRFTLRDLLWGTTVAGLVAMNVHTDNKIEEDRKTHRFAAIQNSTPQGTAAVDALLAKAKKASPQESERMLLAFAKDAEARLTPMALANLLGTKILPALPPQRRYDEMLKYAAAPGDADAQANWFAKMFEAGKDDALSPDQAGKMGRLALQRGSAVYSFLDGLGGLLARASDAELEKIVDDFRKAPSLATARFYLDTAGRETGGEELLSKLIAADLAKKPQDPTRAVVAVAISDSKNGYNYVYKRAVYYAALSVSTPQEIAPFSKLFVAKEPQTSKEAEIVRSALDRLLSDEGHDPASAAELAYAYGLYVQNNPNDKAKLAPLVGKITDEMADKSLVVPNESNLRYPWRKLRELAEEGEKRKP